MLNQLDPSQTGRASALFTPLAHHLSAVALLNGDAPGTVWVDDPNRPRSALARIGHRFFLAGDDSNEGFNRAVRRFFLDEIYPAARAEGQEEFALYYPAAAWEGAIPCILEGKYPNRDMRHYYELKLAGISGWQERAPQGFRIQRIDPALLDENLENSAAVRRETISECPSLEYFLAHRFGFCLRSDRVIASWCMSEYNSSGRCEIGIETVEAFQRRGYGVLTAGALIDYAYTQEIERVGWHCWAYNLPSVRTALRLGFAKVCDYPIYFAWFDECANLAVQANIAFNQDRAAEAIRWFEMATQAGQPPLWSWVVAAFAYNRQGEKARALACLRQALDGGFDGLEWIRGSEHLQDLHDTPEWRAWLG